jgi:poly-gamma-glutamate synthesis protein (capsule biosynthesis protein)
VRVVEEASLLETAWNTPGAWAILPFDQLAPRWKALAIDGVSPFASDSSSYELALPIGYTGTETALAELRQTGMAALPQNRDPALLTTLLMTGVTALSRHIGEAMEEHSVLYPAQKIQSWFDAADLTHISNEVSFYQDCPRPGPLRADMRFCSAPKYMALLEAVGADVIELTGNHNLDWGQDPYRFSLDLYRQAGMAVYGGGLTLLDAQQPLTIEHHGNRLAFSGCSPAGPENVWAAPDKPGSAPCDFVKMEQQIMELRAAGYLPVVTLQAVETDTYNPGVAQGKPVYRRLARAGAVIVSGSQAHVPQTMTFVEDHFVHYGLGNLFFDQMEPERARQNFIDRHIFYNGRYLGVELLTTMLEDSAQPRPMTVRERRAFLEEIFSLSDWSEE